jgi:hypothetical protein
MGPSPPDKDDAGKPLRAMPQPVLHANDGVVTTAHPLITRKRSATVALVAITLGAGVTAYSAWSSGTSCQQTQPNPNQIGPPAPTTPCSQSHGGSTARSFFSSWSGHSSSTGTSTAGASSSVARGGFGGTGAAHASASG